MKSADHAARPTRTRRRAALAALLLALPLAAPLRGGEAAEDSEARQARKPAPPPGAVEVRCTDGSLLKLTLRDERVEVRTRYGKLLVPVADIERVEFAFRLPEEVARRVEAAVADLGQTDYRRREAAMTALLELQERAYPALLKAEKSGDLEVARRAKDLLEQIREAVPAENLEFRTQDVIYTEDSKITGHITSPTLKVYTSQFGEQALRLTEVRTVVALGAAEPEATDAMPSPGTLASVQGEIGKTYSFLVTGAGAPAGAPPGAWAVANGNVWGTDVYTVDSALALAAVHAGVLKAGQTGVVRVTLLGPQAGFQGSVRNGVATQPYAAFNGFKFVRGRQRVAH